jgi:hypothetical protein
MPRAIAIALCSLYGAKTLSTNLRYSGQIRLLSGWLKYEITLINSTVSLGPAVIFCALSCARTPSQKNSAARNITICFMSVTQFLRAISAVPKSRVPFGVLGCAI